MHIKLVVNSFPTVSETFLFNLVTTLEKRDIKVTVCATTKTQNKASSYYKLDDWSGNLQIILMKPVSFFSIAQMATLIISNPGFFLKMFRAKGYKKGISNFIKIKNLLKGRPDIIHFSFSGIGIAYLDCLPYLQREGVKTIVSCRGSAEKVKPLLEPERGKKLALLFSQVDLIHCVSKDMRDGLAAFGLVPGKTFINYPSIETDKFLKNDSKLSGPPGVYSIVTTGRLHFQKGYIFALQAMKILKEKGFKFTYHILGDGPDRAMITHAIHELGLTDAVRLYGQVSSLQVFQQLNTADVFLLPSVYEGIANAALEAMSMEIPLITTKAGGMAEVVQHGWNGMIVECFDGPAIANAIEEVLTSRELRLNIAKNGRITVEKDFTLEKQIDVFVERYKSILNVD